MSAAKLIGVGVGPGDPELMTLKATRALGDADVIAHFAKAGRASHSRAIAARHLRAGVTELPLLYPVTTEIPARAAPGRRQRQLSPPAAAGESPRPRNRPMAR